MSIKWKILSLCSAGILTAVAVLLTIVAVQKRSLDVQVGDEMSLQGRQECSKIALAIQSMLETQNDVLQNKVNADLNVAEETLHAAGPVRFADQAVAWNAVNQYTQAAHDVDLPRMCVGDQWLGKTADPDAPAPVVDKVKSLVGGTCTIFQRMNEAGDMLRVSTNVLQTDGQRAIGTYIPAVSPDRTPNPVVVALLAGRTYYGRAYVVNAWYLTAYKPLRDGAGRVVGALYVGIKQENVDSLRQAVMDTVVGKTGYVFVLGGSGEQEGNYIISHQGQRDGENILGAKDANGNEFIRQMITEAKAKGGDETVFVDYWWKNQGEDQARKKVSAAVYFEPWDWVIGAGAYEDDFQDARARVGAALNAMILWTAIGAAAVLLIAGGASMWVTRRICKPINQVTAGLKDAAEGEGDLTKRIHVSTRDEIGELARWFNTFVQKVHDIIAEVSSTTRDVAGAATQIAASSEQMAAGMKQQTDQTTQVSSAVEEMSATVVEVARKSADAANSADSAGKQAGEGGQVVDRTVEGMKAIADVVNQSAEAINELGKRGEQIGQVIEVITDIADQTNLLALNAAIEAARAGEHGRGFAVVADEVRKLAERTMQATEEVATSIKAIQEETHAAVQRMGAGTERVGEGVQLAEKAGESLKQIVNGSRQVAEMIQSIAAASEEQSAAAEQISRNVESINAVTRQSAEGADQAANAATQLSSKAEQLQRLVGQFRIQA